MPRNCGKYSLTNAGKWIIMKLHTVILCPFAAILSNMDILTQIWAAVK